MTALEHNHIFPDNEKVKQLGTMPADGLFLLAELHDNLFEVMGTRPIITAVLV